MPWREFRTFGSGSVRRNSFLLLFLAAGCVGKPRERFEIREPFVADLEARLAEPAPAVELHRGAEASLHLVQVREGVRPHYHRDRDETVYVLRGEARFTLAGEEFDLRPGMLLHVPRRLVHSVRVMGKEPCAVLSIFTPPFDGEDRIFVE
jgi:mannose-6-phosphate isomerase-like protein (cupin superfamily)